LYKKNNPSNSNSIQVLLHRHANFIVVAINSMGLGGLESPSHALDEFQIPSRTSMGLGDAYN